MTAPARADAEALDAADPLAPFRRRFVIDEDGPIYLDGNSLGRLPRDTPGRVRQVLEDEWGAGLVGSWASWIDRARLVGDRIGAAVLGAAPGQVVVGDSTTVQLYKGAVAALDARPDRPVVVTDVANFPTNRFVLQGLADARGVEIRLVAEDPDAAVIAAAVAPGDVALVTLSHVAYRSGALADLPGITAAVHDAGALMLWDLSHSVGAVPVDLDAHHVDLAVGCTYKYLNGGPGAPAFLYVATARQEELQQPIWGWFGAEDQFAMADAYRPAPGIDRFQVGTPPIVGLAAVDVGVGLFLEAGIGEVRRKGVALTELLLECHDAALAPLGVELATPRDPHRRGSHVSFRHPAAWPLCQALAAELGVVADFREPDVLRFGLAPLSTRFVDVWEAADRLRRALDEGLHGRYGHARSRVT